MSAPHIVIVEDNPSDVYILRRALDGQNEPVDLEILADGEAAMQFVQRQREDKEPRPCVILLDLHLPKRDGLEVLRAIRQEPVLSHIKVVVITNAASPQEQAELRSMGAHYRLKPSRLSEFADLAAELIALCKGMQLSST
jgi:CheY-like chemotaxis protein